MSEHPTEYYQVGSFAVGNRLLDPDQRSVQSDARRSNTLTSGHRACQGCGEALGARYVLDAAMRASGDRLIATNATGCLEVFSTPYPESSWQLPWVHSLFGNAPAVATGVAAALKVKGRSDVRVIGQGGDGGTVDIGLGCLSGMCERGDDVLYVCYDDEAYMNTGVQRSGATPPAARTATTQAVGPYPGSGFPQPTGELEELEADSLVLALGQEADLSLLDGVPGAEVVDGVVQVDERMMTGRPGIFAGGDMVPAERTVTVGIGHGKQAARCADAWLRGVQYRHPPRPDVVGFDELNPWYYSDAPRTMRPQLDLARRQSTFDEVLGGLDDSTAKFEARRCLSCGNCFACDNCFGVCPDNAVIKLDQPGPYRYEIDLDFCKGCGLCAAECPCGAIEMEPEEA